MSARERVRRVVGEVRAVLVPWAATRVLVAAALVLARGALAARVSPLHRDPLRQGLYAWDASFYRAIAEAGYRRGGGSLRFFPLFPLLGRALGDPFGHADVALVALANLGGLAFLVLLARLVRLETGDDGLARRTVWIAALVPPALSLVLAYAEAVFLALAVGTFLALRTRRWEWAAAGGLLAALCRPVGILLAVPAAIEAARGWRGVALGERARRITPIVAPVAGVGAYLAWVGARYGDPLLPLHIQTRRTLRGGLVDPVSALADAGRDVLQGRRAGSGPHLLWALVFLALLVVAARRLPASHSWYGGLTLLGALAARNLDSLERYALGAFPLLIAAGMVVRRAAVERAVEVSLAVALVGYSVLAFLGRSVP